MNLYKIPRHKESPYKVWAVVEIPKDTNVKYEYDPNMGAFMYDRSLLSAMIYPASYGFIPSSISDDGDALDIFVYNAMPIERGSVVECRVIGVMDMLDDGERDYKVLGVPTAHIKSYESIEDVDPLFLQVCKNFFSHYKDLSGKEVEVFDWHDKDFAYDVINESMID